MKIVDGIQEFNEIDGNSSMFDVSGKEREFNLL